MGDWLHQFGRILSAPQMPFWLNALAAAIVIAPALLVGMGVFVAFSAAGFRGRQKRLARSHGWKWLHGSEFSGRLTNGSPWEGGAYRDVNGRIHMNWTGGPLACRTERKLLLIPRLEFERESANAHAVQRLGRARSSAMAERQLALLAIEPSVTVPSATVPIATVPIATVRSAAVGGAAPETEPPTSRPSQLIIEWSEDPDLREIAVENRAFQERFVVLCENSAFAKTTISDSVVAQLLDWDLAAAQQFRIRLKCNRLTLTLGSGTEEPADVQALIHLALNIAENASASNACGYCRALRR